MNIPFIDAAGIDAALAPAECIELMQRTLRELERGGAAQPLRSVIHLPDGSGSLYTMPAFTAEPRALTVKMITIFHGNDAQGMPSHQGLVVVFDPDTGAPAALLDGKRLTALRTAAVTAVATRALARVDAATLAVLGAGVQAGPHIEALLTVREFRRVRIWSRTAERAEQLAASLRGTLHVDIDRVADARTAVTGADVVCTVTTSAGAVLEGSWLEPGTHVNAVGASTPATREVDSDAVARSTVFVDSIESARHEAGDLLIPLQEGRTTVDQWTALGAVLDGTAPGRRDASEITLFKSLGLAAEDAAAAGVVAARHAALRQPS